MLSASGNALPFWIPARFLLTGAFALPAAFTALAVRPDWLLAYHATPPMLAVVHTVTLLFATTIFAGAVQQLAPVLLATPLYSVRLARWSYPLVVGGAVGVVAGFAGGYRVAWLVAGGVLALAGLVTVAVNLIRTAARAKRSGTADGALVASFVYLVLTVLMGTLLAASRRVPELGGLADALPLHLGLGLFGAFFLGIASAGHKLVAMFVLSHGTPAWPLRWLAILVHAAMALLLAGVLLDAFSSRLLGATARGAVDVAAAILLAGAVGLFLLDTALHLRNRKRRALEAAIRHYVAASAFLVAAFALAAAGGYPAAIAALLAGFLPLLIGGMAVKILAFLTWQHRYAPVVGRKRVPLLRDMPIAWLEPITLGALGAAGLGVIAVVLWDLPVGFTRALMTVGAAGAWALLAQGLWIVFGTHAPTMQEAS